MARTGRWISAIATACLVVFLLLLPATRAGRALASVAEEKRSCQSQSHKFKGKCFSDHNCASVCNSEHFPGGKCVGFRQRCFCTRPC